MHLITYGDDPSQIKYLKTQFINLGLGKKYIDTFSKFEEFKNRIDEFNPDDILIFIDGYDVVQMRTDLDNFIIKFKEFDADLVLSAETYCWPSPWMAGLFPQSPTKYRFPNCGTFVGKALAIRQMLYWDEYRQSFDDQGLVHDFFLRQSNLKIKLDYKCELFHCATFVQWSEIEETRAWFVHFNGKSYLTDTLECIMQDLFDGKRISCYKQHHIQ
jgi:hypothetical protein